MGHKRRAAGQVSLPTAAATGASSEAFPAPMSQVEMLTTIRRVEAVINCASGAVGPGAPDALKAFFDSRQIRARVTRAEPAQLESAVQAAVAAGPDLLVTLAGDGTASLAADLCGPRGPAVVPLPGGTMNLLPQALYGDLTWPDALATALRQPVERWVSGGEVDGRRFYCAAILGSPALWAAAREAARQGSARRAWRRARFAWRRAFGSRLRFLCDGRAWSRGGAVILICPRVSRALESETALEAATLDLTGATEAMRLGLRHIVDDWRRDPAVVVRPCVSGTVWARRSIPALFDGEMHIVRPPAQVRFIPQAFRTLAPEAGPREPASRGPTA